MYKVKRRKPMKKKGRTPTDKKTLRRELTAIERAFIAGACITGGLSHNNCANLFPPGVASKSTITRTVQRVNQRATELNTTIIDRCCYKFPSTRGAPRLLNDEQRACVVELTIASQKSREKDIWQAIKDRDFVNAGLPNFSVSLHENIMYDAGYVRRQLGWKSPLNNEQKRKHLEWALVHNPDKYEYGDSKGFDFTEVVFTDETPARIGEERGMQRVWCRDGEQYDEGVKKDRNRRACCLQFYC